jgi:hypothetical protein
MSILREAPYSLQYDHVIRVKISACNINGCGEYSDFATDGAKIQTEPATVTTLSEGILTNEMYIQILWTALAGEEMKGSPVTSYHLQA